MADARTLPHLAYAVIGHVDHGKSSLAAALSRVLHGDRVTREQLLDAQERCRDLTILGRWLAFASDRRRYTHGDCPGHADYFKNTIKMITQVDAVVLVVDAAAGPRAQTREHLEYARAFGVRDVLVFLNKCDQVDSAELLDLAELETRELLTAVGFDGDAVPLLRGSALAPAGGDEPIYALRDALDRLPQPERDPGGPPILPVHRRYSRWYGRFSGGTAPVRSTVVGGRLARGTLRAGDEVELFGLLPPTRGPAVQVRSFATIASELGAGEFAGCQIGQVQPWDVARGQVLSAPGALEVHRELRARIALLPPPRRPGARPPRPLRSGYRPQLYARTADVPATLRWLDRETADPGDVADAHVTLDQPIALAGAREFVLRHGHRTIGVGTITELVG